jgi:hypothetical protein
MFTYGGENCCDGPTSWSFTVNGGESLDFTVENLNGLYPIDGVYPTFVYESIPIDG